MAENKKARDLMIRARLQLLLNNPFFGTLVMFMKIIEDNSIPTACTDGKDLWYNPDFIISTPPKLIESVLIHELYHIIMKHHLRRGARNSKKFNRAADYVVNQEINAAGYQIGEGWLLDGKYHGMTAEMVYAMLPDEPGDDGSGDGEGGQGPGGKPGPGDFREPKGQGGNAPSPAEISAMENDINSKVVQAANAAKKAGKLPAGFEQFVKGLIEPEPTLHTVLSDFVDCHAKADYSFAKLSRSAMQRGFVSPGRRSDELGHIFVVIDTSGSISRAETDKFLSMLFGIADRYDCEISIATADTEIYLMDTWEQGDFPDPEDLVFRGGGGTSLQKLNPFLEESGINPVCIIYMTDAYLSSWGDPAPCPLLVAVDSKGHGSIPDWCTVVEY